MKFKEKNILVTGSSRGIGYGIAEKLASDGANLIINGVNPERVEEAVKKLADQYPESKFKGIAADLTRENEVKKLYDQSIEFCGRMDGIVNNAGVTRDNLILRMSEEDWNAVIDANLKSAFLVTKIFIRSMLKTGGKIVMMSSVVGEIGNSGQANYAASKGGLIAMGKSLAREFAAKKININIVTPGFIDTEMTEVLSDEVIETILATIPQKRLGQVSDVANLVAFLMSDESDYITGQVIGINGGMSM